VVIADFDQQRVLVTPGDTPSSFPSISAIHPPDPIFDLPTLNMASPTTTEKVLIDLSTNDTLLDLSKNDQLKEQELRRKVSSTTAKLEAAKKELAAAEKAYYEASDDWNAAREQPGIHDGQLNYIWEQCEDNRKRMQPVKILAKKSQEEADLANVAMRDFENQAIQAKLRDTQASTYFRSTLTSPRSFTFLPSSIFLSSLTTQ
jgi:hypothetical protein